MQRDNTSASDHYTLRPLDLGGMLDGAFALYRRNFVLFAGIVAVLGVPQAILSAALRLATPSSKDVIVNTGTSANPTYHFHGDVLGTLAALAGGSILITWLFSTLMTAALAVAISQRYLGRRISVGEAYASVGVQTFVTLLVATVLQAVAVVVGLLFLVVPGIILIVRWLFLSQVLVLERAGLFGSFGRSRRLTRGSFWRIVGYGLVLFLLISILTSVVTAVIGGVAATGGTAGSAAGAAIAALVGVLIQPFQIGFLTLLYYDLRIRKEGFDLEHMAIMLNREQPVSSERW